MKKPSEGDMALLTNYIASAPEQMSHVPGRGDPEPNGTYRIHVNRDQRDWIVDALRSYPKPS